MQYPSLLTSDWGAFLARLSPVVDLDKTAFTFKALLRRRGVKTAESLLRLGLGYGPGGMSLREASAWAGIAGIAQLKDTSLLDRLRNASDWFAEILRLLLSARVKPTQRMGYERTIRLVDGSTLSEPGSKRTDWRLHATYDLASGTFTHIKVTDKHTAESLTLGPVNPGEIRIADRGYAKAKDLAAIVMQRADFIVRVGWTSLRLLTRSSQPFELFAKLADIPSDGLVDIPVLIAQPNKQPALPVRLIILAKPAEAAEKERTRVERRGSKKQHKTDPRSIIAAGYIMIVTSLAADAFSVQEIAALYRFRWQIELAFKRLKSLLHIDRLRAFDPELAKTWIYAHLIAALVIDSMTQEILESSPCGP
jgi:hypothetical protein